MRGKMKRKRITKNNKAELSGDEDKSQKENDQEQEEKDG